MDLEDINPIALALALVAAIATVIMFKASGTSAALPMFWTVATPVVTFVISYFIFARQVGE